MSLARNTAVIGGLTLVSRLFGFARDLVLAAALGAGPVADAFFAALRFPNLFRRLFAEGAFSQAFVPVYSKTLAAEGQDAADQLAAEALSILLLVTGVLSAIAIAAMSWINRVLFVGYIDDPEAMALANLLTQIATALTHLWELGAPLVLAAAHFRRTRERPGRLRRLFNRLPVRNFYVLMGVAFHLSLALSLRLGIFPFAMLACFPAFFRPAELEQAVARLRAALTLRAGGARR